jgi:hypothetical protein
MVGLGFDDLFVSARDAAIMLFCCQSPYDLIWFDINIKGERIYTSEPVRLI